MDNGLGYLLLFFILASLFLFFFWLYEVYRKSFKDKDTYKDEFDRRRS